MSGDAESGQSPVPFATTGTRKANAPARRPAPAPFAASSPRQCAATSAAARRTARPIVVPPPPQIRSATTAGGTAKRATGRVARSRPSS